MKKIGNCLHCGKEFEIPYGNDKKGFGLYCSRKCSGLAKRGTFTGPNNPRWSGELIYVPCEICGKKYKKVQRRQKYCSRECYKIARSIKYSGKNHYKWNNGASFGEYCEKFNSEFKKRVRLFWNNTCVVCGQTHKPGKRNLIVHHVYSNKDACCNTSEHDTNKFVVLCNSCHARLHGYKSIEKKKEYISLFEKLIEERENKCYYTREEYNLIVHNRKTIPA